VFNVGGPEIVVILLVALVILGPDQLPKAMRTFGNVMAEIRKVSGGFQDEMRKAMDTIETNGSSADDKPMSPKPPSGQPGEEPVVASSDDLNEVVARNTDHDAVATGTGGASATPAVDQVNGVAAPEPTQPDTTAADRAAG
jgi:sec-independent protein translocase protein TatB